MMMKPCRTAIKKKAPKERERKKKQGARKVQDPLST